jgi:hypothetical protein
LSHYYKSFINKKNPAMAKRHKKKKTTHRRRRVSGINANSPLVLIAAAAGGYFLGPKLNDKLTAPVTATDTTGGPLKSVDPKIIAAGEILMGIFLPKIIKKQSIPLKILSGLLIGAGVHEGLKALGVVSGLPTINGPRDLKLLAGMETPKLPYRPNDDQYGNTMSGLNVIAGIANNRPKIAS